MPQRNDELESYKDAVWDFMLEHSDITKGGALFVKFHTDNRKKFENRIIGRWKYNYHRGDPRLKEKQHEDTRQQFEKDKHEKEEKYKAERKARIEALNKVKRQNERRIFIKKITNILIPWQFKQKDGAERGDVQSAK